MIYLLRMIDTCQGKRQDEQRRWCLFIQPSQYIAVFRASVLVRTEIPGTETLLHIKERGFKGKRKHEVGCAYRALEVNNQIFI